MVKPVPLMLLPEIETAAVPLLESVTDADELPFTATPPKLMFDGFALSSPRTPVPPRGIDSVPFVAVDVIVMLPESAVAAVGANEAEKLAVPPAAMVWLALIPLMLNPDPDVAT
jgi:hypothetical protein